MRVIISGQVWLPRSNLKQHQIDNIINDLTIYPKKTTDILFKEDPHPIFLFSEDHDNNLIGVPRNYYLEKKSNNHEEVLDISYGTPMQELTTNYRSDGPYSEQEDALNVLINKLDGNKWGGVLLRADPGFGKTYCSIELARRLGRKTLILVHKDFLLKQWKDSIAELMPDAIVGIIKQKKCEYDELDSNGKNPDFVIGMLQSLVDGSKYPDKMWKSFGTVIFDECHRVAASSWSLVVPKFNAAYRVGVSATPRRLDGAQDVFFKHISDITYSADTKLMIPKLRRIYTSFELRPISRGKYHVDVQNLNSAQILSQLSSDNFRNRDIIDDVFKGVVVGRKILIMSERLEHLRSMADRLNTILFDVDLPFIPTIDFYTGQWFTGDVWEETKRSNSGKILHKVGEPKLKTRTKDELHKAESANVIFCTKKLIEEGFNLPAIDVLVLATPMSDIEQVVGRVQRWCVPSKECYRYCSWRANKCKGKSQPIIVDVIDDNVNRLHSKYRRRLKFYKKIGTV